MAKKKTLYVVVHGEENEGDSPISIHEDLRNAEGDVEHKRYSSYPCDLTYIEVWEKSTKSPGRYDFVHRIPESPTRDNSGGRK